MSTSEVARMRRRLVEMLDGGPVVETTEAKPKRRAARPQRKRDTPETTVPEVAEDEVSSESQSTHAGDDGS